MKNYFILLALLPILSFISSCSKDEIEEATEYNDVSVVVNDDGTTSNGSRFAAVDNNTFYLDYIKYSVEEGHLIVSGYDKAGFDGNAKIVSAIVYRGNSYEVLAIGNNAFKGCKILKSVSMPSGITSFGENAFRDCSALESITMPEKLMKIGETAFYNCSSLKSIYIPWGVSSGLSGSTFFGCTALTSITVDKRNLVYDSDDNCNAIIKTNSHTLIRACQNTIIPERVTEIGDCAFAGCTGLTSITIPSSVTWIYPCAFYGCTGLTSITIPASVRDIGYSAFDGCSKLKKVTINSQILLSEEYGYLNLKVCFGNQVEECIISEGITSIGEGNFAGSSGLKNITIPSSVTSIEARAFNGCSSLTSITIPLNVTRIGGSAFASCTGLTEVHCKGQTPPYTDNGVFSDYTKPTLYVPTGYIEAYKGTYHWKFFSKIVEE